MIIHNITFCVERSIAPEFIDWLRGIYVPAVSEAGLSFHTLARVMGSPDPSADSYALQFSADGLGAIKRWTDGPEAAVEAEIASIWGERVLCFTINLQVL